MNRCFYASALALSVGLGLICTTPAFAAGEDILPPDMAMAAMPMASDAGNGAVDSAGDGIAVADDQQAPSEVDDLLDLSLEELLAQEVTSVAKKARRIADSAAAVTVITQDDIRRSSARTVPDLLRMVPGMEVAEVQSSSTSVSARGFTSRFAANLLVMIDGASIYSTSISGMFWDQALIPLQDIERIEVIRGPGGALWGSNAINGVVNIITKQSVDTQGLRLNASWGTFDHRIEAGFGKQLTDNLGFRVYGDYRGTKGLDGPTGSIPSNNWKGGLAGVRFDYAPTTDDNIVVLAEYSEGRFHERFLAVDIPHLMPGYIVEFQRNKFETEHALARWTRAVSDDFDFSVQAYFNRLYRTEFGASIDRDLYDLSAEGRWRASDTHEFNFGVAGRLSHDTINGNFSLSMPEEASTDRWLSGYIQDDISIIPDKLRLTLGSKFEVNNFTGTEIQPSARLFYRFSPKIAAWASVSRAVRTPLLMQRSMIANVTLLKEVEGVPGLFPVNSSFNGNPDAKAERVTSFEAGIRGEISPTWSFDVAAYYSNYDRLTTGNTITQSPIIVPPIPFPVGMQLDFVIGNAGSGDAKGFEALISGKLAPWWKGELSYSYLDLDAESPLGTYVLAGAGSSPNHQIRAKSSMELGDRFSFDTDLHFVGAAQNDSRDEYFDLDMRATYRMNSNVELSVVGSNLLDRRRLEYYTDTLPLEQVYVPRTAYAEVRLRF